MSHPTASDPPAIAAEVHDFLLNSLFHHSGAVMTDLDGTAVHEEDGRVYIPPDVEYGLKSVHDRGRSVVINTLRFPWSVIRVFGNEWHRITGSAIPLVSLKGSQIGHVVRSGSGALGFEEIDAFPLLQSELEEVMQGIEGMVRQGAEHLLVFFYPRDWRLGELIWTPEAGRIDHVREKYLSAAEVFSGPVQALRDRLFAGPQCLVFLLNEAPEDKLMAYQHTERSRFITHEGVDKRHGAEQIARRLDIALEHSIGAGDAETDTFLAACGLAAIVGNQNLDFKGLRATVRLRNPLEWGQLLFQLGRWSAEASGRA